MTAKKIVIPKGKERSATQGEAKPTKPKRPGGPTRGTPKIDIGLDKVLPSTDTPGAAKAGAATGAPPNGKPKPAKPMKPIVIEPRQSPTAKKKDFKFLCNACGKKLQAAETMAGQTTTCPDCGNAITIPQPTAEPQTKKQQKRGVRYKKPKTFKFFCVRCGQNLEADRALAETQLECPHCKSVIAVPQPADA